MMSEVILPFRKYYLLTSFPNLLSPSRMMAVVMLVRVLIEIVRCVCVRVLSVYVCARVHVCIHFFSSYFLISIMAEIVYTVNFICRKLNRANKILSIKVK